MSYSLERQVLGQATRTQAGSSDSMDYAEYVAGILIVHIFGLSGTGARLYPVWRVGYSQATGYATVKAYATGLKTVGTHGLTLPLGTVGRFHKVAFTVGGTSPQVQFSAFFVGKAI
jgi:hypothetical protein